MNEYLDLQKEISEIVEFHREGFDRVKTWYQTSEEQREEKTDLIRPPHVDLVDRAAGFVEWGLVINESTQGTLDDNPGVVEIHETFLAIGAELLLKSAILKTDPEYYFDHSTPEQSMKFEKAQNKVLGDLSEELTADQRKRLKLVLDLLKVKRDEAVHFGFHRRGYHWHPKEMYKVLDYLFKRFGGEPRDVNGALEELIEDRNQRHTGKGYERVEYPEI